MFWKKAIVDGSSQVKSSQESFIPKTRENILLQVDKQCTNKNQ
jgi:hypothetical protein